MEDSNKNGVLILEEVCIFELTRYVQGSFSRRLRKSRKRTIRYYIESNSIEE